MNLIGICGKKGSGKDTAGAALVEQGYQQIAFAGALKAMTSCLFRYLNLDPITTVKMIYGDLKEMPVPELGGRSTRYAMQTLGTEWGRLCIDKDLWINIAIQRAQQFRKAVITDVRFPNEAKAIQNAGGIVVRIYRNGCTVDDYHPSEIELDNVDADYTIYNDSSLETLLRKIKEIAKEYETRH
jgi:Deoxynucleotide monophosphate kinase